MEGNRFKLVLLNMTWNWQGLGWYCRIVAGITYKVRAGINEFVLVCKRFSLLVLNLVSIGKVSAGI